MNIAVVFACSLDLFHKFLRWVVFGDAPANPLPPRPSIDLWLAMSRDYRGMRNSIESRMSRFART